MYAYRITPVVAVLNLEVTAIYTTVCFVNKEERGKDRLRLLKPRYTWPWMDLNHQHFDFRSNALPIELRSNRNLHHSFIVGEAGFEPTIVCFQDI